MRTIYPDAGPHKSGKTTKLCKAANAYHDAGVQVEFINYEHTAEALRAPPYNLHPDIPIKPGKRECIRVDA